MKISYMKADLPLVAGFLLIIPALYFFIAALFNYVLQVPVFWDLISGYFERPANKALGWNANLVIAFGPLLAVLINLPKLVQFRLYQNEFDNWQLSVLVHLTSARWLVIAVGALVTGVMIAYLFLENCHCS